MSPQETRMNFPFGLLLGFLCGFALMAGPVGLILGMNLGGGTSMIAANVPSVPSVPSEPLPPSEPTVAADIPAIDPKVDHILGNPNAKISVVEYSDFECPFCKRHHPTMTQLLEKYGDDVNWVYRHYPLSFHPQAEPSAIASECVAEVGGNDAFWKFTDAIMLDQNTNVDAAITASGVDAAKVKDCITKGTYKQKVADQMAGGSAGGIDGTPGNVIVNNETGDMQLMSGAMPLASFTAAIDPMLQ
jgi:protein-disulfide isomerase